MVSAVIEARSCERFAVLSEHCNDRELAKLYSGLYASEAGHYRIFIELARSLPTIDTVEARWNEMLDLEVSIIRRQRVGPTMHSGVVES